MKMLTLASARRLRNSGQSYRTIAADHGVSRMKVLRLLMGKNVCSEGRAWSDAEIVRRVELAVRRVNNCDRRGKGRNRNFISAREIRQLWVDRSVWAKSWSTRVPSATRVERLCPRACRARVHRYHESTEASEQQSQTIYAGERYWA